MAEVKAFHVNNLPNDNHLPFILMVLGYAKANQMVSTQMAIILAAFEAAVRAEDDAMHQLMGSPLTSDIEETDKNRDTKYYIIDHMVDVYLHYPAGSERTAAEKINKYLKVNKVKTAAQYDRETGQILNLVQDLEANCTAEMQLLGLTEHVAELKRLNQQMFDLLQQRDEQNALKVSDAVRNARQKADKLYHCLVYAVNAFAYVDANPYLSFIRSTNQTIDRLNLQVFKITGSSADKNEVDSPTSPGGATEEPEDVTNPEGGENTNPEGGEQQQPEGGGGEENTTPGEQTPTLPVENEDYTFVDGILTWLRASTPMNFTLFPPGTNAPATECAIPENATKVTFIHADQTETFAWYEREKTIVSQGNLPQNEEGCIWSGIYSRLTTETHTVEEVEE